MLEPELPQASWTYGEGIVHHCAFQVDDYAAQDQVKFRLEGMGFTDTSERKDRGYFDSIYVRTPAGALFEATVSKPGGMTVDETHRQARHQLPGPTAVPAPHRGAPGVPRAAALLKPSRPIDPSPRPAGAPQLFWAHAATHARIAFAPSGNGPGVSWGIGPLGLIQLSCELLGSPIGDRAGDCRSMRRM